ncbi:MAG: ubiquitin-like small modifier protein 1 [Halobacteriaceae archaeon]
MQWTLFADLADVAGDREVAVDLDAGDPTVRDALDALFAAAPGLEDRVCDGDGSLRDHVNVLRNGETLDESDLDQTLDADDELALFPPVSGG